MGLYYSLGETLVRPEELNEELPSLNKLSKGDVNPVEFPGGTLRREDLVSLRQALPTESTALDVRAPVDEALEQPLPFKPIGVNRPLTIRLEWAYPGNLPPSWFGKGALISSAVKSEQTFDAQPRALNVIVNRVQKHAPIAVLQATQNGTSLIFHSPAVLDRSLVLTLEMAFDNVDTDFFGTIGTVLGAAGGLPVFAAASPYLLAAGTLVGLGANVANRLFDAGAEFRASHAIDFDMPGRISTPAGFYVLTRDPLEATTLRDYALKPEAPLPGEVRPASPGGLTKREGGTPYQGDTPYLVISLDGTPDENLDKGFMPTAVTAALLTRFYAVRDASNTDANELIKALTLFNDLRYRNEADQLNKRILGAKDEEAKHALSDRRKSVIENIQEELLKPQA